MKINFGELQTKQVKFNVTECKQDERNGVPVGIFEGFASTFDEDRGKDVILPGAFIDTIARHAKDARQIRMLRQHDDTNLIGGFPIEFAKETEKGLFVQGQVNLTPGSEGELAFSLMKQGVLVDMSIGFSIDSPDDIERREVDGEIVRFIKKITLWEISLVNEPMNPFAQVVNVKTFTPFLDLPLASRKRIWDSEAARSRVEQFQTDKNVKELSFWYDDSHINSFVDVVDGELKAVPRAIFEAAANLQGIKNNLEIPEKDRPGVRKHIEQYYQKMDLPSPFTQQNGIDNTFIEICETVRDVEECLKFLEVSAKGRKTLISKIKGLVDESFGSDLDRDDSGSIEAILKKCDEISDSQKIFSIERKLNL